MRMNQTPIDCKRMQGLTLLELMVAMTMSGFVIVMASNLFLYNFKNFHIRSHEAEALQEAFAIDHFIQKSLTLPIENCSSDQITIRENHTSLLLSKEASKKYPTLKSIKFNCLQADTASKKMEAWKKGDSPDIVQYSLNMNFKNLDWNWRGSVLLK